MCFKSLPDLWGCLLTISYRVSVVSKENTDVQITNTTTTILETTIFPYLLANKCTEMEISLQIQFHRLRLTYGPDFSGNSEWHLWEHFLYLSTH